MAAIDRIYAYSKKDFLEFYEWCDKFKDFCLRDTQLNILDFFYCTPETWDNRNHGPWGTPITRFPFPIDKWLAKHCPVKWVRDSYDYIGNGCKKKKLFLYIDRG